MNIIKIGVIVLSVVGFTGVSAETILKATYSLKWGNTLIGNVQRTLEKTGDTYTFISDAKPKGLAIFLTKGIYEKSTFKVKNHKIIPISYRYEQKGKKSKTIAHEYNWAKKTLKITQPHRVDVQHINANTVDALNSQYLVMLGLSHGENTFKIAMYDDDKKARLYDLRSSGRVKLKTPAGVFDTILVRKLQSDKNKFSLWCAPSLNYLPVKITHVNKKGQTFTMALTRVGK